MTDRTLTRYAQALQTCRLPAVVDVAIAPASPDAPLSPVVEIVLVCSSRCGHCGRCSDGARGNATCADCGDPYDKGEFDADDFCDGCRAQRDAHTDALEIRFAMAKARQSSGNHPAIVRKDVA